jgi:16S rRNA (adenine1518-N6/adenine1519-N6)-dimethyltransferase
VEADRDMVDYLDHHFPALAGHIIRGNFLRINLRQSFQEQEFGLIGNFPYNISSQILFKMLENRELIPEMVGMFQREMAERIIAPPGSKTYGVISVLTQAFYEGKILFGVDRKNFSPPPKVKSAVIRLQRLETPLVQQEHYKGFRRVVKMAFNQRRKMLRNTLKPLVRDKEVLSSELFSQRPEQLSVEQFVEITLQIEDHLHS